VAKIRFDSSVKLDVLGKWQQPILAAVKETLPGSKPSFTPLPMGRAGLMVSWNRFKGHDVSERQELVRDAITTKLGANVSKLVSLIVALTPDEIAGLTDT
jgi:hypothetical protein